MMKAAKILGTASLVATLAACGGVVSFKNAKLWSGGTTQTISGVIAKPEGTGPFPAVVLLHHCGGLTDNLIVDWPDYLTSLGYVTLSVDSLGPRGFVHCSDSLIEQDQDAYGALDYLASLPFVDKERIGVMGFSMGGNTIDDLVRQEFKTESGLNFKAAVNMYGFCHNLFVYTTGPPGIFELSFPTMVIVGELDRRHVLSCEAAAGKSPHIKVHVLPDTHHSFDNERYTSLRYDSFGNSALYSWEATKKARELTKVFLGEHLGR